MPKRHVPDVPNKNHKPKLVGLFDLPPGGTVKVYLGKYREADSKPTFGVLYIPAAAETSVSYDVKKLSDGTVYLLYYVFQNTGPVACSIRVERYLPDRRIG